MIFPICKQVIIGYPASIEIENVHLDERYMVGGMKTEAGKNRIIPIGKQMKYSNYRREKWDNIIEKLQFIDKHLPHDCRHTFAGLMDDAGANKLCTKRIIGHSSPDLLDKVYTHKEIEQLIQAIDMI